MRDLLLTPFSWLYVAGIRLRRFCYERGVFASVKLGAKTISVGNITVGGTGKTPLVQYIAAHLLDRGETVCILTRGYGRDNPRERVLVSDGERVLADARDAGDEPFELATKLGGRAVIIADANRAAAGDWALTEFNISVFILDDGFQHLRVKRDLDILLIDASKPFANNKLLPAGILREPKSGLERVNAFVITRANLANNVPELRNELAQLNPTCPQFVSQNAFIGLKPLNDRGRESSELSLERIRSLKSAAFCAIGNPENFFQQLENENFNLAARQSFRDHHFYLQRDVRAIEELAIKSGAEVLLTTAKDAVKLSHLKFNLPCFVIENGLTFEDEPAFLSLISNLNQTA